MERLGKEFDKHLQEFMDGEKMTLAKVIAAAIGIPVFPMRDSGIDSWPGIDDEDVIRASERILEWHDERIRAKKISD